MLEYICWESVVEFWIVDYVTAAFEIVNSRSFEVAYAAENFEFETLYASAQY